VARTHTLSHHVQNAGPAEPWTVRAIARNSRRSFRLGGPCLSSLSCSRLVRTLGKSAAAAARYDFDWIHMNVGSAHSLMEPAGYIEYRVSIEYRLQTRERNTCQRPRLACLRRRVRLRPVWRGSGGALRSQNTHTARPLPLSGHPAPCRCLGSPPHEIATVSYVLS